MIAVFLGARAVVAIGRLPVALFRKAILRSLFGVTQKQLERLARLLARVAERAAERDTTGEMAAARDPAALALARYAWITTRQWIIALLTARIAAMAAQADRLPATDARMAGAFAGRPRRSQPR